MTYDRLKYVALAALVALGLVGVGVRYGSSAPNTPGPRGDDRPPAAREHREGPPAVAADKEGAKAEEGRPAAPGRRREAVIRLPAGTFVKEVDVGPYGSGRLTWTYEEDRVLGLVEANVMGFRVELETEAEYALSSNGTLYGLLTAIRLNRLVVPDGEEWAEIKLFAPAAESLVTEMLLDLPFSYRFRVQGERLIISNFRTLLAGPNPLGKAGGLFFLEGGKGELFALLTTGFQALGAAVEGTYTAPDARDRPARRPISSDLPTRPPLRKKK